jgi:1-acyl-sn-glycerol-3-phosphate acyltransferase
VSRKRRIASRLFRWDAGRRLRAALSAAHVRGLGQLRELLAREPLILALNHVAFWDGFLLSLLEQAAGADAYCLMDRANLAQLGFLMWAGALPIERAPACHRRRRRDLQRAAALLDRPGRLLVVFPHGAQRPPHLPLDFQRGVLVLAKLAGVRVVPAGLRYDFGEDPRPAAHVSLGRALRFESTCQAQLQRLEEAVRAQLDAIDALSLLRAPRAAQAAGFTPLIAARARGLPVGSRALAALFARRLP